MIAAIKADAPRINVPIRTIMAAVPSASVQNLSHLANGPDSRTWTCRSSMRVVLCLASLISPIKTSISAIVFPKPKMELVLLVRGHVVPDLGLMRQIPDLREKHPSHLHQLLQEKPDFVEGLVVDHPTVVTVVVNAVSDTVGETTLLVRVNAAGPVEVNEA